MFNYQARQIFVIQPRNAGGGVLSFLFSLDCSSASVHFKRQSLDQKLHTWNTFLQKSPGNAHIHGFMNFGHVWHQVHMEQADDCTTYIHKNHFHEIFAPEHQTVLGRMPNKQAIGLYLSEGCVEKMQSVRPETPKVDWYQLWMYANQTHLLREFFSIDCRHVFPFSDMLEEDMLMDHLMYCRDLFVFDTDIDIYRQIVRQWHSMLKK